MKRASRGIWIGESELSGRSASVDRRGERTEHTRKRKTGEVEDAPAQRNETTNLHLWEDNRIRRSHPLEQKRPHSGGVRVGEEERDRVDGGLPRGRITEHGPHFGGHEVYTVRDDHGERKEGCEQGRAERVAGREEDWLKKAGAEQEVGDVVGEADGCCECYRACCCPCLALRTRERVGGWSD